MVVTSKGQDDDGNYGIRTGRSDQCVYVDKRGNVQQTLDFGIARVGDTKEVGTNVALMLEFDDGAAAGAVGRLLRGLSVDAATGRYLLADDEKAAIGSVTAEVLATALDARLAEHGVQLNSVDPKEVIVEGGEDGDANQLAVALEIRGHYSPPPAIDFDYIVQDSINRDTATIRRGLREYNRNCRDQTAKVNEQGLAEDDFATVVSQQGAVRPVGRGDKPQQQVQQQQQEQRGDVFSTACSSDLLVPEYFETNLKEIEARDLSGLGAFGDRGDVTYLAEESRGALDAWAVGPVAAVAGLIVLLMGAFVFRRALGPRLADGYRASGTKDVDGDEARRFGEAGGDADDGSVDSIYYSEDDTDSDVEETEKERKMRRKKKEKADEQGNNKSRRGLGSKSRSMRARKKNAEGGAKKSDKAHSSSRRVTSKGSDDTDSMGKSSESLMGDLVKGNQRKVDRKQRSSESGKDRRSSSDGAGKSSSSDRKQSSKGRGRSRRSGGDNNAKTNDGIV